MISEEKFHKLCKYSVRLGKSYISNNQNDYLKYCLHLKYHIGKQIGSGTNPELDVLFNVLTKYIEDNKFDLPSIKTKFEEEKNMMEIKLEKTITKIKELELKNQSIEEEKTQLTNNNIEINLKLEEMKNKLNLLETNKKSNEELIQQLELEIDEIKNKLEERNSNEFIIDKLEYLQTNKYNEFKNLLNKLFTKMYDNDIASNILDEIGKGETWKDTEEKNFNIKQRENETIDVTLFDSIEKISLKTLLDTYKNDSDAKKLIKLLENYINNEVGELNEIKNEYIKFIEASSSKISKNIMKNKNT